MPSKDGRVESIRTPLGTDTFAVPERTRIDLRLEAGLDPDDEEGEE